MRGGGRGGDVNMHDGGKEGRSEEEQGSEKISGEGRGGDVNMSDIGPITDIGVVIKIFCKHKII